MQNNYINYMYYPVQSIPYHPFFIVPVYYPPVIPVTFPPTDASSQTESAHEVESNEPLKKPIKWIQRTKNDHKLWSTDDDTTLLLLAEAGKNAFEIALEIDRTAAAVIRRASDLGFSNLFNGRKWSEAATQELLSLPNDRKSLNDFAERTGRTKRACYDKLRRERNQINQRENIS